MDSIISYILKWSNTISEKYSVNPLIFGVIYTVSVFPFWFSLYKIVECIKKHNVKNIVKWLIINGIAILSPFIYVAIFGRNLPNWFWIIILGIIILSVISLIKNIKNKISQK